ncbi:TPX2 C-terminal domain-containing protein [Pleurotus pulmonarius]
MPASSIFARPASPPPRAPSPVFEPEPLPSPQLRMRQPRSQTSMTSLQGMDRSLFSARSCSNLRDQSSDSLLKRKSSRLTIDSLNSSSSCSTSSSSSSSSSCSSASSPITPRSFTLPLPPIDSPAAKRTKSRHHRSHSIVVPSPRRRSSSPPPAPSPREAPPPVPAIPAVLLTPTDKKPVLRTKTGKEKRITPIYLPELDIQSLAMGSNPFSAKAIKAHEERERDELARVEREGKEQEKEKKGARRDTAMTCLKFFSMKNASAAAA